MAIEVMTKEDESRKIPDYMTFLVAMCRRAFEEREEKVSIIYIVTAIFHYDQNRAQHGEELPNWVLPLFYYFCENLHPNYFDNPEEVMENFFNAVRVIHSLQSRKLGWIECLKEDAAASSSRLCFIAIAQILSVPERRPARARGYDCLNVPDSIPLVELLDLAAKFFKSRTEYGIR